jgi:hypothetical protein
LAENAGGALGGGVGFEKSELKGCGVGFAGSGDLDIGGAVLASLTGLGGPSSFEASTTGGRTLGFGVATLFGLVVVTFGAGRV